MRSETAASLIEAVGSIGTTVAKELFARKKDEEMLEQKAQFQKELAAARAGENVDAGETEPDQPAVPSSPTDALSEAETVAADYEELMNTAADMESCDLCKRLIQSAKQQPAARQADLLPQLREFMESVEDGESTQQVAQRVREQDELLELLHETME